MFTARLLSAAGILLLAAARLAAHHSLSAEYQTTDPVELRGAIVRVEWTNPHTFIHIAVAADNTTWQVEGGSPANLTKLKVTREMLAVGTTVTVKGFRARNAPHRAAGHEITFADGTTHLMELQPDPEPVTFRDRMQYSLPRLLDYWLPYLMIATLLLMILIVLFWLRSQGNKART